MTDLCEPATAAPVDFEAVGPIDRCSADRLLLTTRSIRRRLDLDRAVDPRLIEEALEVAVHAPTASNRQSWRWVVITEPALKEQIADCYRLAWGHYRSMMSVGRKRRFAGAEQLDDVAAMRTQRSAEHLAENLHRVPVLVIPCVQGHVPDPVATDERWRKRTQAFRDSGRQHHKGDVPDPETVGLVELASYFGSIFPAVWSFQLALRARGLGSSLTSMHLPYSKIIGEAIGIPPSVTQTGLVAVGHLIGEPGPAPRLPASELTCWNRWTIDKVRRP
ncbi:MAG TPA: nitroreductase family protein [Microthrixaceae bacterium]|nr:nitroreductase family protein [Microthrixaceae bacterium]